MPSRDDGVGTLDFGVDDARVAELAATRQGRVSQRGFLYQAGYAVARLASMHTQKPVLSLGDIPLAIRYDWAEDLDEVVQGNGIVFTQCKHVDNIGEAIRLATVLLAFAPKLLWTNNATRERIILRLVCTDNRFANSNGPQRLNCSPASVAKAAVLDCIKATFTQPPTGDRTKWRSDADAFGHQRLAQSLWDHAEILYLDGAVVIDRSVAPAFPAERAALDLWISDGRVHPDANGIALSAARALIHGNLIAFDPSAASGKEGSAELEKSFGRLVAQPKLIERGIIRAALAFCRYPPRASPRPQLVTRDFLREQASLTPTEFVARLPTWADVARGPTPQTRFIERAQTAALSERVRQQLAADRPKPVVVSGPPGSGKTTLARRVAALLVQAGDCVVMDPGLDRGPLQRDEGEELLEALNAITQAARKVLLVLDDPFFDESGWPDLLRKVQSQRLPVTVLAASPTLLYEQYGGTLSCLSFPLQQPTEAERRDIREAWQCDESLVRDIDDFWLLCVQVAEGRPAAEVMRRLWRSLNDGRDPREARLEDLSWRVVAFTIACFFGREAGQGHACPEPLLARVLAGLDRRQPSIASELAGICFGRGWDVFRVVRNERDNWDYEGALIGVMHTRLAEEAWRLLPSAMGESVVARWIVDASLEAPECVSRVALLAGVLRMAGRCELASLLAKSWAARRSGDLRHLSSLANMLWRFDCASAARQLHGVLRAQATEGAHGWLALSTLLHLGQALPDSIEGVLLAADFSWAPHRAVKFFKELRRSRPADLPACRANLRERLGEGEVSPYLVTWVINQEQREQLEHARDWRSLQHLLRDVLSWLSRSSNREATDVYVKLIDLAQELPGTGCDDARRDLGIAIKAWLSETKAAGAGAVWTKYLHFLRWPRGAPVGTPHQIDALVEFSQETKGALNELRAWAVRDAWRWLCGGTGEDSTDVRTQYLRFLWTMDNIAAAVEMRREVADRTLRWLRERGDTRVRDVWSAFLGVLAAGGFENTAIDALEFWVERVSERSLEKSDQAVVQELPRLLRTYASVFAASPRGARASRCASKLVACYWHTNRREPTARRPR